MEVVVFGKENELGVETVHCYLCNSENHTKRPGSVRDNKDLDILECQNCGLVFLSARDHISEGFYEDSQMHAGELNIDAWQGDTEVDDRRRFEAFKAVITNKRVLDFGCGNGGFLKKARSISSVCKGVELEQALEGHFKQQGLEVYTSMEQLHESGEQFDVITLFHVLEHLPDPIKCLNGLKNNLSENGQIIVEVPNADDALLSLYQSGPFSHFTYWSCHLYLFNNHSLNKLANVAGFKVKYIKQVQRYSLANHLHWLGKGKPGGHQEWSFIDSPDLHTAYENSLAKLGLCDTVIMSLERE